MDSQKLGYWINPPKHCGTCGKELKANTTQRFDRMTGQRLPDETTYLSCPDGHESWGRNMIGTWGLVKSIGKGRYELREVPIVPD